MEKPEPTFDNIVRPKAWRQSKTAATGSPAAEPEIPAGALTWRGRSERSRVLEDWRAEVGRRFLENALVLRFCWSLEATFGAKGFTKVTDKLLARKLDVPLGQVVSCLIHVERAGLIVKVPVEIDGKTHRRVWPARIQRDRPSAKAPNRPTTRDEYQKYLVDRLVGCEPITACEIPKWFNAERDLREACGIGPDWEADGQQFVRLARARRDELLGRVAPPESGNSKGGTYAAANQKCSSDERS